MRVFIRSGYCPIRDIVRRLVFVAGIHGVGKSTICHALANLVGAIHLSSGELISRTRTTDPKAPSDKRVGDVQKNQDALITALEAQQAERIILDGHFVLLRTDGQISEVPMTTFTALAPSGVVLLIDAPRAIASRLSMRDGKRYSQRELAELQERERAAAVNVTISLDIPLHCATPADDETLMQTVQAWFRKVV